MPIFDRNRDTSKKEENMLQVVNRVPLNLYGYRTLVYPFLSCTGIIRKNLHTTRVLAKKQCLPALPVPELDKTLKKFLKSAKPFLTDCEYEASLKKALAFSAPCSVGDNLQCLLKDRAKKMENWLEDWWIRAAYLDFRSPVVIFSSPGLLFPEQKFMDENDRVCYTAQLILANVEYKQKIDNDEIPMEKMGKAELDMGQYKKVYGTCRIPGVKSDRLDFNPDSTHIVVVHNNNYFKIDLCNDDQELLSLSVLIKQLKMILKCSPCPAEPVGLLTTEDRNIWGCAYKDLMQDCDNKRTVKIIQKALFLVCLDQPYAPCGLDNLTIGSLQCIHGGGVKFNGGNRWYDKTIQFCIGSDGLVGLTYEHSPSEGQPIAVLVDFLVDYIEQGKAKTVPEPKQCVRDPEPLPFVLSKETSDAIYCAGLHLEELIHDFDLFCFNFTDYGKEFVKKQKFSPDSYIQMALQFTFYRLHEEPGAHYESASLRQFQGGRTETIRSCSEESVCFAQCMIDCNASEMDKFNAMKAAIDAHKKYTTDALNGQGVDRHLLGLKLVAMENNIEIPDFYSDPAFVRSVPVRVTSSQVATRCRGFMSYGPTSPNGYAICYNPRADDIYFGVSSLASSPETCTADFVNALKQSLRDMCELLCKLDKCKL